MAEHVVRSRLFRPRVRLRVDLHGVSAFGPGDRHTLIRWEWVERISVGDGVVVDSAKQQVRFPPGAFGLQPGPLAERLERARALDRRPDVIEELATGAPSRG